MRPKSATAGPQRIPVTNSHVCLNHVSHHDVDPRCALAALGEQTCDDLAILVVAAVSLVASLTFRDYGLGWDDYTHAEYADLLLRMYGSGFKDTGALSFVCQPLYVWRRLRHGRRAAAQDHSARTV